MSPQWMGWLLCGLLLVIAIVSSWVVHDERKQTKLGEPQPDERNWSTIFMKDVKNYRRT